LKVTNLLSVLSYIFKIFFSLILGTRGRRDRTFVGFTITSEISAYHH